MKIKLAIAAATLAVAQTASAATLNLVYEGAAPGYQAVTIDQTPVAVVGGHTRVNAGGFNMTDSTPDGFGSFVAWCLDLAAYLGTSGTHEYETTESAFGNGGVMLGTAGLARIASVFNANYGADIIATANSAAAFQLALWESVYDTDQSITSGVFQASSSTAVETLAQGYLTAAANYTGPMVWDLTYLESTATNRQQNLVTADISPVPLPASGLLLLAAFGGLAAAKRRKAA